MRLQLRIELDAFPAVYVELRLQSVEKPFRELVEWCETAGIGHSGICLCRRTLGTPSISAHCPLLPTG
jgi:hypothetical protein